MAHVFRASVVFMWKQSSKTDKDVFVYDVLPASEEPVVAGIAIDICVLPAFPPLSLIRWMEQFLQKVVPETARSVMVRILMNRYHRDPENL